MARIRKVLLNKHVAFITSSVEEGLPLPPNPLMNTIIESVLARAQHLYPVRISHHLFQSNHLHLIAIVDNPDDIERFMRHLKTESAHAINRLLGRKKRKIWCDGYDSPLVLTVQDVIDKIVYLYTNPSKDNLEDSIDKYPGLSSWKAFQRGNHTKSCPHVTRDMLHPLKRTALNLKQFAWIARGLREKATEEHEFRLFPDAWMEAFDIVDPEEKERINKEIIYRVRAVELEIREERQSCKRTVFGARRLMLQPMNATYIPNRKGRRTWCISCNTELRADFILMVKALIERGREVYERWKIGDFSTRYPPGLFPPSMPKLVYPIGSPYLAD